MTHTQTLSDLMDFDHVITVHEDGTITDAAGEYAPGVYDDQVDSAEWELLTGHSGQYGYSGPIMHESEFIGGGLEDYIRATPGTYVSVVAYGMDHDCPADFDGCDYDIVGWAIARKL